MATPNNELAAYIRDNAVRGSEINIGKVTCEPVGMHWLSMAIMPRIANLNITAVGGASRSAIGLSYIVHFARKNTGRDTKVFWCRYPEAIIGATMSGDDRLLLVEDIVLDGKIADVLKNVADSGLRVEAVLAVIDKSEGVAAQLLDRAGVTYIPLLRDSDVTP